MRFSTGHPIVDAIGELFISGNVVHHSWYQHIRYLNKRGEFTDPWAVLILADIVYWYRPVEVRDETTGHLIGYRKKFAEDKLQRSPEAFAELLHCSPRVARASLELLETLGLIDIELRAIKTAYGTIPTAMFIGLSPERLSEITHNTSKAENTEKSFLPKSVRRNNEMGKEQRRNGLDATTNSVTTDDEMGNSSIYRDFSKDFSETLPQTPKEKKDKPVFGDDMGIEEEPRSPSQSSLTEQPCQPINGNTDKANLEDNYSAPPDCDNTTIDTRSGAYRMEQRFRQVPKLPAYRTGKGANGIKVEFLEYLRAKYLPTVPHYQGKLVELIDAKTWVFNKENAGQQELVEARYEQMLMDATSKPSTTPQVSYAPPPERKCYVPSDEEREAVRKMLLAKKAK